MQLTREIYWNVGHGAATLVPMYAIFAVAFILFFLGFLARVKVYKQGLSLDRTDNIGSRILEMCKTLFFQTRVRRSKVAGTAHAVFFWAFFILLIGTGLIVVQADFTDLFLGFTFLKGKFYLLFSLTLDLAGLFAICMLAGLAIRRYMVKPQGLMTSRDDAVIHSLLMGVLITGYLIEGCRMAVTEIGTPLALWSPGGNYIAMLLSGLAEKDLRLIHYFTWWIHLVLAMGIIAILPRTKLRHIFTTSLNYFFTDRGPTGKLPSMDLEDDEAESFGASTVGQLTWKDIFDSDACTLCNRCQDQCPAFATQKPLSPMEVINQLGEVAYTAPEANLQETIGKDSLWSCTTCRACQDICPASIEHVNKIVEMRRSMVLMDGEFPGEEVMAAMEQTEVNSNPLGIGYASRGDWAEGLDITTLAEGVGEIDILYFVGCYGSFDKRNIAVARSFVKLCGAAGIKVGILGKEEKCCGEPMRKMGNEYLYQTLAAENIELLKKYKAQTIVTSCPHCFNTLDKDYRDLGLEAEVLNHTVYLENLVSQGKLKINGEELICTYHDSCYLGRHNGIYSSPRALITAAGGTIIEMGKNREQAFCCGAGGGRILAEEKLGERINNERVKMAEVTGASTLLSNCPFCLTMFEDGVKGAQLDGKLIPKDIAEVLAERI